MQYNDALVDYAPRNNEGTLPDYSTSGGGYYRFSGVSEEVNDRI